MNYSKEELIKYRIERAIDTFEDAIILSEKGKWNAVINRLYYASFYSVNALFLSKSIITKTHSGVRSLFHLHFIKTGIIKERFGEFYSMIFDLRHSGDYGDMVTLTKDKVEPLITETEAFITIIKSLVKYNES
ncbi:MAG: HEPN domain-containing protein [Bacteroidales bacterium]|nr:HEPN domain-containing protein [Bacteroidales bacterium]